MRALLTTVVCEKGDVDANLAVHIDLLEQAARSGCELVVFPEFSLTGSVDPMRAPGDAVPIDHAAVTTLAAATGKDGVAAVFGLAERSGGQFFITQAVAAGGRVVGWQRKRHLGEDELGYSVGEAPFVFALKDRRFGVIICAEGGVDWTWDATAAGGADIVLFCSAPGLYGRRTDEAAWRSGFEWWEGHGLGQACTHASRLHVAIAMSTQAGATVDEDFPGIAALISPEGDVIDRLPDWRTGTLVVEL